MRILKFGIIGVANTLITLAVFNVLAVVFHAPAVAANALGWMAGFANSYFWNRRWTFADRTGVTASRSLVRFALSNVAALLTSSAVIVGLERIARGVSHGLPDAILLNGIEALAIVVSLGVNYTLATLWAFRDEPAQDSTTAATAAGSQDDN